MDEKVISALKEVLGYLYHDEQKDFDCMDEDNPMKKHHIFHDLKVIEDFVNQTCRGCYGRVGEYPALSRYGHGDICSGCGTREALEGNFIGNKK